MGNERATYGHELGVGKQTLASAEDLEMCVPGKATLAEEEMSSVETDLMRVARRSGERVVDRVKIEYVVKEDASFEVVDAPVPYKHAKGRRITIGEMPGVWGTLHDLVLAKAAKGEAAAPKAVAKKQAQPRGELTPEETAANVARVKHKQATVTGTTLAIAKTKADAGNANTHYARDGFTRASSRAVDRGDKNADTFYCSAFAMWTLAAAGYDLSAPILGTNGVPFTYSQISESADPDTCAKTRANKALMKQVTDAGLELADNECVTPGRKITFRSLIDSDPIAVTLMSKIRREGLEEGKWLGIHRSPGLTKVFDEMIDTVDNTDDAAKGLAGAFEAFGIGTEVPEAEQKPGDFAQTRYKDNGGWKGHAFQVWSVHARGSAMLGETGSPVTQDGTAKGWQVGVEYVIDKDTDPALVGEHAFLGAQRIEANIESSMVPAQKAKAEKGKKAPAGDGGVQISDEKGVVTGAVVFYGRLASSPWSGWKPATKK